MAINLVHECHSQMQKYGRYSKYVLRNIYRFKAVVKELAFNQCGLSRILSSTFTELSLIILYSSSRCFSSGTRIFPLENRPLV